MEIQITQTVREVYLVWTVVSAEFGYLEPRSYKKVFLM